MLRKLFREKRLAAVQNEIAKRFGGRRQNGWHDRFAAVVCAEDAPAKKPDPLAYRIALERLQLSAAQCVALEDSPVGLAAATALGIPVVITRSHYFADDPVPGALAHGPNLGSRAGWSPNLRADSGRVGLADIQSWLDGSR